MPGVWQLVSRFTCPGVCPLFGTNGCSHFEDYRRSPPERILGVHGTQKEGACRMTAPIKTSQKLKSTKFVLRPYRRVPSWHALYYMSGDTVGKGVVTNLSRSGLRVQGEHALAAGIDLSLRVVLSEGGAQIEIQQARVQWVSGCDFGVKIVRMSPLAATQITHALAAQLIAARRPS